MTVFSPFNIHASKKGALFLFDTSGAKVWANRKRRNEPIGTRNSETERIGFDSSVLTLAYKINDIFTFASETVL